MRQLLGPKKIRSLERETGLEIDSAMVRGGTGHRIDIFLKNGDRGNYYRVHKKCECAECGKHDVSKVRLESSEWVKHDGYVLCAKCNVEYEKSIEFYKKEIASGN